MLISIKPLMLCNCKSGDRSSMRGGHVMLDAGRPRVQHLTHRDNVMDMVLVLAEGGWLRGRSCVALG